MSSSGSRSSRELPVLVVQLPDGKETRHSILGREITIGRGRGNRICIPDHFVSKFHAKLIVHDRVFTLVDLGSANRTRVNGCEISESQVDVGDHIQFADVSCRLEGRGSTVPDEVPVPDETREAGKWL